MFLALLVHLNKTQEQCVQQQVLVVMCSVLVRTLDFYTPVWTLQVKE